VLKIDSADRHSVEQVLERKLQHRPERDDLVHRHILPGSGFLKVLWSLCSRTYDSEGDVAPALVQIQHDLQKHIIENQLEHKLAARPTKDDLVQRHILPEHPDAAPLILQKQQELQRALTGDALEHKLAERPARDELVKRHILEKGTFVFCLRMCV
jgi:hypothetical protein